MRPQLLLVAACAALAGCMTPQGEMMSLAEQRLALAPDVAWYKYSRDLPLYDPARETAVLQNRQSLGRARGIPDETTRRFFNAQMEASRRVQWEYFHLWRKGITVPTTPPRDLMIDLRPRIDMIDRRQIELLARGAQPPSIPQLSEIGERFLPKN
jgi:chorismate mutase